jgi:hypothetical protein
MEKTRHCCAGLLLFRPCGTGCGFTAEWCDGRAVVRIAGNIHLLANRKILNLDESEDQPSLRDWSFLVGKTRHSPGVRSP